MQFCKVNSAEELLRIDIQKSIIDYVVSLRENKISYSTIHVLLSAIYHFCEMNDVMINKKKIRKYKGERMRVVKDRCYTHEEIGKILNLSDLRVKLVILLMSSSGLRVGSIPSLQLKHLEKVKVGTDNIYKILVYENTNDEYFSFFPPQTFQSPSFIVETIKCSICNMNYKDCPHVFGRPYMGQLCLKSGTIKEVLDLTVVSDPVDRRRRILGIGKKENEMRDVMTWRIYREDYDSKPHVRSIKRLL